jgi:N-acetyl-anhydromuramyl-L-alanine amidase AmpD
MLDIYNHRVIGGIAVSARIAAHAKECLWSNREAPAIDTMVFHYISAVELDWKRRFDVELIMLIFCDLAVSAHYLIARSGEIYLLVPEEKKAWHCGGSMMPPPDNRLGVNDFSIGVELVATDESGFTKKQYASLGSLCADVENRRGKEMAYVGHQDIAGKTAVAMGLRKDVKTDPGARFDWRFFREILTAKRTMPR